jgi:hypothetical protein
MTPLFSIFRWQELNISAPPVDQSHDVIGQRDAKGQLGFSRRERCALKGRPLYGSFALLITAQRNRVRLAL